MTVEDLIKELEQIEDKTLKVRVANSLYFDNKEIKYVWLAPDCIKEKIQVVMIG